ncbi:hypothetical protein P5673_017769 [Acropora cervicornis]|uniref:Uncharacterized protein n=1 Tax=Acropora cervicornis TaxID=6130 RepID=A0AAD9V3E9_ACRCE|nr:hypothetical protein P5673_017769 [Acropora cervicornis]
MFNLFQWHAFRRNVSFLEWKVSSSLNACKKPNVEERLHIEPITKLFYESGETGKSKHSSFVLPPFLNLKITHSEKQRDLKQLVGMKVRQLMHTKYSCLNFGQLHAQTSLPHDMCKNEKELQKLSGQSKC